MQHSGNPRIETSTAFARVSLARRIHQFNRAELGHSTVVTIINLVVTSKISYKFYKTVHQAIARASGHTYDQKALKTKQYATHAANLGRLFACHLMVTSLIYGNLQSAISVNQCNRRFHFTDSYWDILREDVKGRRSIRKQVAAIIILIYQT